jgi:hypothetical protein
MMDCSYKLTQEEMVKAMQLHGRGTKKTLAFLCIAGVVLVLLGAFSDYKAIGFIGAAVGVLGYFIIQYLSIPLNAKRQYKQNHAFKNEIHMTIFEQGINFKSESGESKLLWSDIHKWKNGNGVYLLYITSNMFHMVPSRELSNEKKFSMLLSEKIGARTA